MPVVRGEDQQWGFFSPRWTGRPSPLAHVYPLIARSNFHGPYMHIYTNAVILCFSHRLRSPGCCRLFSTGIRLAFQALQGIIKHPGPGPQGLPLNSTRQEEDSLLESVDTEIKSRYFFICLFQLSHKNTRSHTLKVCFRIIPDPVTCHTHRPPDGPQMIHM